MDSEYRGTPPGQQPQQPLATPPPGHRHRGYDSECALDAVEARVERDIARGYADPPGGPSGGYSLTDPGATPSNPNPFEPDAASPPPGYTAGYAPPPREKTPASLGVPAPTSASAGSSGYHTPEYARSGHSAESVFSSEYAAPYGQSAFVEGGYAGQGYAFGPGNPNAVSSPGMGRTPSGVRLTDPGAGGSLRPSPARSNSNHSAQSDHSVDSATGLQGRTRPVVDTDTSNLPPDQQPASAIGNKYGDYPPGWTKADEEAEREFLRRGLIDWRAWLDWKYWIRWAWWYWYLICIVIIVLVVLMTVYNDQIVEWLQPAANWMKNLTGGWVIPIVILFILSFPPLFGQEIVAMICGIVWGLWIGFGLVCAGTFFGEVGNYYAFRYVFRSKAEKYEGQNMGYACLAHVMREGGFLLVCAARMSAIPGHLSTAVFATCGMSIWTFMAAAIVTLPKQILPVYLGVVFEDHSNQDTKTKIISYSVLAVGFLITVGAVWWIYWEMHKVRVVVWRKQRLAMAGRGIPLSNLNAPDGTGRYDDTPVPMLGDGLARRTSAAERTSYVNPYDIRYDRRNDMSIYHVDAMSERLNIEEQMAQRLRPGSTPLAPGSTAAYAGSDSSQSHSQGTSLFPQAQPAGVRREPSAASVWQRENHPQPIPSQFPVAAPMTAVREDEYDNVHMGRTR